MCVTQERVPPCLLHRPRPGHPHARVRNGGAVPGHVRRPALPGGRGCGTDVRRPDEVRPAQTQDRVECNLRLKTE